MWDAYMKLLQTVFTPLDIELMHLVMIGVVAKMMLSGLKWVCAFLQVEVNRTAIQVATLPVACLCLYAYCGLTGCDFSLVTAKSWGQTLVSALTSIGIHEASKTSFMADIKKLANMILDKLKKQEPPKV